MDELDDAALAAALAEAGAYVANQNFQSVASVGSALNRKAGGEDDPVRALVVGLEYHLVMDAQRRGPYGAFGPMIEMEGRSYPPPIDQIDNAVPGVYVTA